MHYSASGRSHSTGSRRLAARASFLVRSAFFAPRTFTPTNTHAPFTVDVASLPYNPIPIRPDIARPNPKMGIADLAWSPSGRWLASYNRAFPSPLLVCFSRNSLTHTSAESYPTTLWMYTFSTPSSVSSPATSFHPRLHSVLVHTASIRSFTWQTGVQPGELLAIGTGVKGFTVWREPERGAEESEVETEGGHGKAEGVGVPAR